MVALAGARGVHERGAVRGQRRGHEDKDHEEEAEELFHISITADFYYSKKAGKAQHKAMQRAAPSGAEKGGTRVNKDYMTSCWVRVSADAEKGCSHPNSRKYRSALYAENMTEAQAARFVELCIRIAPMLSLIAQLFPKKDLKTFNPKYVSCDNGHGQ